MLKRSAKAQAAENSFPYPLLNDAAVLASFQGWREQEYEDLLAVQRGVLSEAQFREKYCWTTAIMVLDMTDFTKCAMQEGALASLLKIVEAHQVCIPALNEAGAGFIRSFADDLVALFENPSDAVGAAFEIHARMQLFAERKADERQSVSCCIGIGYGEVMKIGPNFAQGDEMNRASVLGEDIADGGQTLVTHNVFAALRERQDMTFKDAQHPAAAFPFYRASPAA